LTARPEHCARSTHPIEIADIFGEMFRLLRGDETFLGRHETILGFSRRHPETAVGYQPPNDAADSAVHPGDSQMRTFSFIMAFAFFLVGPSLAGSSEAKLPGIGTFSYNGSSVNVTAPQAMVVAAR
jgi:hypothetical protein